MNVKNKNLWELILDYFNQDELLNLILDHEFNTYAAPIYKKRMLKVINRPHRAATCLTEKYNYVSNIPHYFNNILCPHCGYIHPDAFEWSDSGQLDCYYCDNTFSFQREVTTTYCTSKV